VKGLILDVGSGGNPLIVRGVEVVHCDISRNASVDVLCDAHHLPFRDNIFSIVYASHVIEHCINPAIVLQEFKRVSRGGVIIKVMKAKLDYSDNSHLYSWNEKTLKQFLRKFFSNVEVYPTIRFDPYSNPVKRLLHKLKVLVTVSLFGRNELTAICRI